MQVIQCDACAGSVVYDAKLEVAACLFCGSVAVHPDTLGGPVPTPDALVPFTVERSRAQEAFVRWARSSWWYPKQLRCLSVQLHDAMLPAWRFEASLETHWAGLTRALTKSGLRPVSGVARLALPIMVPASLGLTEAELGALQPFDLDHAEPWREACQSVPCEVPSLSQTAARQRAQTLLSGQHRERLAKEHRLQRCRGSSLIEFDAARLLMLPIWIGSFRYRGLAWRLVINAQTGRVTGRAPLDRVKVAAAIVVVAAIALAFAWWQSGR